MSISQRKRGFALGYSLILHSCITYIVYTTIAGGGLSTIVAFFCEKTGLNSAAVTSVNTIGGLLACVAAFFISKLVAIKGPRFVTTISFILMGLAMFLLAYGSSLFIYVVFAIIAQVTSHGYCFSSTSTLITNWFPRTKGWVMGWTTTGIMLATPTGVAFISAATPAIGFTSTMNIVGGVLIFLGIISWFWIRNTPEECGLLPDNKPITEKDKTLVADDDNQQRWTAKEILFKGNSFLIIISMGIGALCSTGIAISIIPVMIELGFDRMTAVAINTVISMCSCGGSILLGWTDEKFGTKKSIVAMFILFIVGFLGAYVLKLPLGVAVFLGIAGTVSGAFQNLFASLVGTMYGRSNFATAWSVLNTGSSSIRALVFLLVGTAIQLMGGYKSALLLFGIVCMIALLLILPANCKFQNKQS